MMARKLISGILIPAFIFVAAYAFAADTTPPTGTIKVNNNAAYTNTTAVTLTLSATDTGSAVSQMKFSNNNVTWSIAQAYATTKSWTLTTGNGSKTVYVKFKDASGNWSAAFSDAIIFDTTPPTGSIKINGYATYTNKTAVTLNLSAVDTLSGVSQMRFSNDNITWSAAQTYAITKSWTITATNGTKTVYAKYKDGAGNWSGTYYDSIILDTIVPATPVIKAVISPTTSLAQTLTGTKTTDASYIIVTCPTATVGAVTYPTSTSWSCALTNLTSGSNTISVKARDVAGNESAIVSAKIIVDITGPTGTIIVNSGNQYTNTASVTLTLSATDSGSGVSQMQFSNDNITWSAAQAYATTKSWTLTSADGTKTVYVKYKDVLGNWSGAYSDTIILDTIPPPIILTVSLQDGILGESYKENLNAIDGTPPYAWSIVGQSLPGGLSLNGATGEISGIPALANTFSFIVNLTDARLRTATKSLSIKILPAYPPITDEEQLLDDTQARAALYFYNEALSNGFVRDGNHKDFSSIAATGFGLASLCVMAERYGTSPGWVITPEQARVRVNEILDSCINYQNMQTSGGNEYGIAGFLYHFITQEGIRQGSSEVSTVDMALFLAGAITVGEYFGGEVKTKVGQISDKVNWNYFYVSSSKQFSHGAYYAGAGVMPNTWDRPGDEAMIVSLMALASNPESGNFLGTMYSWPRIARSYGGHNVVNSYFGSLFTYIFAHCYFDFQNLGVDNPLLTASPVEPIDWWANSVSAAKAARQFCIDQSINYSSYGADSWGISACEYPNSTYGGLLGAAPCEANGGNPIHNGTIAPYAAISCLPFMRTSATENIGDNLAFKALKYFHETYYNNLWGPYGPRESFNQNGEFNSYYYGLNLGSMVIMAENYRSRFVWDTFMKNDKIKVVTAKVFGRSDIPPHKTLYVNAANGSDVNQDGTSAHPFSGIQKAIDVGGINMTVNIAPGQYAEAINIISKLKVVLKGTVANRTDPTDIQSNTVIVKGGSSSAAVTIDSSRDVTIDGIVIAGDGSNGASAIGGISNKNSNTVTIRNVIIQGVGKQQAGPIDGSDIGGISSVNSANVIISDNIIRNNYGHRSAGIYVAGGGTLGEICRATILRNKVVNNYAYGGSGGIYTTGILYVTIKNNFVHSNRSIWYGPGSAEICGGLTVHDASEGGEISNNLVGYSRLDNGFGYNYGGLGINCYNSSLLIANNIIENSAIYTIGRSPIIKNNVINGRYGSYPEDLLFVARYNGNGDPYNSDYHLQPLSPLINAGDPDPKFNDKDTTRNDIGLYGGPDADMSDPAILMVPQNYSTIQAAIDAAAGGDVIQVSAGIYNESVTLNKAGIILMGDDRNSVIQADPGLSAVYCETIDSAMTLITGFTIQGQQGVRCAGSVKSVRIEDNNIRVSESGPIDYGYGIYMEDGAFSAIARNNITNCGRAINGSGNNSLAIRENTIDNCRMPGGGGIFLNGSNNNDNVMITGNSISHCLDGAIRSRDNTFIRVINNRITNNDASNGSAVIECIDSAATLYNNFIGYNSASGTGNSGFVSKIVSNYSAMAFLYNNVFYRNSGTDVPDTGSAISLYYIPYSFCGIANNIFVGNSNSAAVVYSTDSLPFSNNDLWNNSCQNDTIGFTPYECMGADPSFVSETDFHLRSGSPCIDSGVDSYNSRDTDGTRIDMGMYGGPYSLN